MTSLHSRTTPRVTWRRVKRLLEYLDIDIGTRVSNIRLYLGHKDGLKEAVEEDRLQVNYKFCISGSRMSLSLVNLKVRSYTQNSALEIGTNRCRETTSSSTSDHPLQLV